MILLPSRVALRPMDAGRDNSGLSNQTAPFFYLIVIHVTRPPTQQTLILVLCHRHYRTMFTSFWQTIIFF